MTIVDVSPEEAFAHFFETEMRHIPQQLHQDDLTIQYVRHNAQKAAELYIASQESHKSDLQDL